MMRNLRNPVSPRNRVSPGIVMEVRDLQRRRPSTMSLTVHLSALEASGLIRLAAVQPELEYLFRHALVQEAAYASLVRNDRKRLHLAVGEALEQLYPDQSTSRDLAPVLGQHFALGGDEARALRYFTLAGDAAARVYANAEAEMHYARALELATRNDAPVALASAPLAHLYLSRGHALELTGQYPEAWRNYEDMEALARARGDRALELAGLCERAKIRSTPTPLHNLTEAQALAEQALGLARELGDRRAECKALWILMLVSYFTSRPREAVAYGEQSLALARELGEVGREQLAFTLNDISRAYAATGQMERAFEMLAEARALWRELNNLPMLADSLASTADNRYLSGDYALAIQFAEEALRVSRSIENLWGQAYSQWIRAYIHWEHGEPGSVIEVFERTLPLGESIGFAFALSAMRNDLGWIYGSMGLVDRGLELLRTAHAAAESAPIFRAWTLANLARLHVRRGSLAEAEAALREAEAAHHPDDFSSYAPMFVALGRGELALARQEHARVIELMHEFIARLRKYGVRPALPDALLLKGKALLAQNRMDEAREALTRSRAEAEALGSRRALWPALAALADPRLDRGEAGRGNATEAQTLRQQAREIIHYIADHSPPDLRASFLNLPEVRAVLEAA
jgi:hypothetical protein